MNCAQNPHLSSESSVREHLKGDWRQFLLRQGRFCAWQVLSSIPAKLRASGPFIAAWGVENRKVYKEKSRFPWLGVSMTPRTALSGIALVVASSLAHGQGVAATPEVNPAGFAVPDIRTSKFYYNKQVDNLREVPGEETTLGVYKAPDGTYFNTLTYNDVLYGFNTDVNGRPPMEYLLLDMNRDGVFETRYALNPDKTKRDDVPSPNWIAARGQEYQSLSR